MIEHPCTCTQSSQQCSNTLHSVKCNSTTSNSKSKKILPASVITGVGILASSAMNTARNVYSLFLTTNDEVNFINIILGLGCNFS